MLSILCKLQRLFGGPSKEDHTFGRVESYYRTMRVWLGHEKLCLVLEQP
jgi:hypothetical protein